jgi:hypothetical protein
LPLAVLGAGALIAAYVGGRAPRDQHVRLVLGAEADTVTGLQLEYVGADGEVARDLRMTFASAAAPRVIAHEPKLEDGDYRLRIDLDTREGRRTAERRVTLGGGTTQVNLAGLLSDRAAVPGSAAPSTPPPSLPPSPPGPKP